MPPPPGKRGTMIIPPSSVDESKYLTIVRPYPLDANLDVPADRRALALWLACCTGNKDVLMTMFHNPASPGIAIIEIDCEFDRFENLLGMHSWSEILVNPIRAELEESSKVFYCNLETASLIEENGWKRTCIEEDWFRGWRPDNSRMQYPYPKPTYLCEVPSEAARLCHPLHSSFLVRRPPPVPIVESPEGLNANDTPSSEDNWKIISRSDCASTTCSGSRDTLSPPPPPAMTSRLSTSATAIRASQWNRLSTTSMSSASSVLDSDNYKSQSPPRRGLRALVGYYEEDGPKQSIAVAMEDLFDGSPLPTSVRSRIMSRGAQDDGGDTPSSHQTETRPENLWDGYDEPREDPRKVRIVGKENERWDCPEHGGSMCSPGICKTRAEVERDRRWKKETEDRERNKRIRIAKARKRERRKSADGMSSDSESESACDKSESCAKSESRDKSESPPPMEEESTSSLSSVTSISSVSDNETQDN